MTRGAQHHRVLGNALQVTAPPGRVVTGGGGTVRVLADALAEDERARVDVEYRVSGSLVGDSDVRAWVSGPPGRPLGVSVAGRRVTELADQFGPLLQATARQISALVL